VGRRIRIRPPGLKPTTKIGTLGPYRGRLGLSWVIAPMILGVLLLLAVGAFLLVGR
jgi:purine-cytosine permease-like protein